MRSLVTGGAGFIGAALTRRLLERGDEVVVVDNLANGRRQDVPAKATFVHADITDLDMLREPCRDIDIVFHQAAIRSVPRSVEDPVVAHEANATGTLNVLIASVEAGARRLVYASSSSVYGDPGVTVNEEAAAPAPGSPYAVSKLTGEYYCRVWNRIQQLSTVSLRYFNVFGPGQRADSRYAAVFPAFVTSLLESKPPEIHWDGEQVRDFSFIEDVVDANVAAADAGSDVDGSVINVAGGKPRTVNETLRAVADAVGVWIDPVYLPKRAGDIRGTRGDITRARRLLGWQPRVPWPEAVARTVRWFGDPVEL